MDLSEKIRPPFVAFWFHQTEMFAWPIFFVIVTIVYYNESKELSAKL